MRAAGVERRISWTLLAFLIGIAAGCVLSAFVTVTTMPKMGLFQGGESDRLTIGQDRKAVHSGSHARSVSL